MESETSDNKQSRPWLFKKGQSGNLAGRPKGSVGLKTWAKEYLSSMTDEERLEFMDGLPKDIIWKMAEGNPENKTDLTSKGESINLTVVNYGDHKPSVPTEGLSDTTA